MIDGKKKFRTQIFLGRNSCFHEKGKKCIGGTEQRTRNILNVNVLYIYTTEL